MINGGQLFAKLRRRDIMHAKARHFVCRRITETGECFHREREVRDDGLIAVSGV